MATSQLACQQLVGRMAELDKNITNVIAAPLAMVKAAEILVNQIKAFEANKFAQLDSLLAAIGAMTTNTPGLMDGLTKLLECPAIQQSASAAQIEKMLDMLEHGISIHPSLLSTLTAPLRSAAKDLQNDLLKADPTKKLQEMEKGLQKFYKDSGIQSALSALNTLVACMNGVCDVAVTSAAQAKTAGYGTMFHVNPNTGLPEFQLSSAASSNMSQITSYTNSIDGIPGLFE